MRALAALILAVAPAAAETLEERVRRLEERLAGPAPAAGPDGAAEVWFDGQLRFATLDETFAGRIGSYVILHGLVFDRLNERDKVDTFLIREAGFEVEARFDGAWEIYVDAGVQDGGSAKLIYGWVEFNRWSELRIRAGLFKEPISMETMEDTRWWDFLENSIVYMHAPTPDEGAMVHGRLWEGFLSYAAGVFNGDGPPPADENGDKDAVARLQITPSRLVDSGHLRHLHAAAGATHGRQRRDDVTPFPFQDPTTDTFFHAAVGPAGFEVEDLTRLSADAALLLGPLEAKAEFSHLLADVDFAGDHQRFRSTAWYAQLGVWLGGRRVPWGAPRVDSSLFDGGAGALQLAGRYARLRMNDAFKEHAGFAGARSMEELAFVANWFPNANVRISGEYLFVSYESSRAILASGRAIGDESVWVFRVQVTF